MAGSGKAQGQVVADRPTVLMYLAGLFVVLSGIQAINVTVGDDTMTLATTAIAIIGFMYSYTSRAIGLNSPAITFVCLVGAGFIMFTAIEPQFREYGTIKETAGSLAVQPALVLAAFGALWCWMLTTNDRFLMSIVIAIASLGLVSSTNIDDSIKECIVTFVFSSIVLLVHHNVLRTTPQLPKSRKLTARLYALQLAVAGLTSLTILGGAAVFIVPVQMATQDVSVIDAIRRLATLTGNARPLANATGRQFSDADQVDVGMGDPGVPTADVLMHVTSSDGMPHYWKGRTYDEYTGDGWQSSISHRMVSSVVMSFRPDTDVFEVWNSRRRKPIPTDAQTIHATVQVKGSTDEFYFPGTPVTLTTSDLHGVQPDVGEDGSVALDSAPPLTNYELRCVAEQDAVFPSTAALLKKAKGLIPPYIQDLYLSLDTNDVTTDADLAYFRAATRKILAHAAPSATEFDKAMLIRDWIGNRCLYSLQVPPIPKSEDHARTFLETARKGYCDLFATAMVVLCRSANIPARLVTGFAPGMQQGNGFDLRVMDKHAWVEVYFPGMGWYRFDPTEVARTDGTPTSTESTSHKDLTLLSTLVDSVRHTTGRIIIAIIVLLIIAAILEVQEQRKKRHRTQPRSTQLAFNNKRVAVSSQYRDMSLCLGKLGIPRYASETPQEYRRRSVMELDKIGGRSLDFISLVENLTERHERTMYADGGQPGPDDACATQLAVFKSFSRRQWVMRMCARLIPRHNAKDIHRST